MTKGNFYCLFIFSLISFIYFSNLFLLLSRDFGDSNGRLTLVNNFNEVESPNSNSNSGLWLTYNRLVSFYLSTLGYLLITLICSVNITQLVARRTIILSRGWSWNPELPTSPYLKCVSSNHYIIWTKKHFN